MIILQDFQWLQDTDQTTKAILPCTLLCFNNNIMFVSFFASVSKYHYFSQIKLRRSGFSLINLITHPLFFVSRKNTPSQISLSDHTIKRYWIISSRVQYPVTLCQSLSILFSNRVGLGLIQPCTYPPV